MVKRKTSSQCELVLNFVFLPIEVELKKAETTSTSRSIRTTCAKSFTLLRSSDSFLSAFSRILLRH